jgi:hypothetical protein
MKNPAIRLLLSLAASGMLVTTAHAEFGLKSVLKKAIDNSESTPSKSAGEAVKAGVKPVGPSALPDPWPVPTEAFVVPSSIRITASREGCYRPTPSADCKGSAWFPLMTFNVVGPLKQSAKIAIQWSAAGKPWFKEDISPIELDANVGQKLETGRNPKEEWAKQTVGSYEFKITASDALAGTNKVLYEGKFKAGKHHTGSTAPMDKNMFEWYVDYDWALPTAYLEWNVSDMKWPSLEANFWFKVPFEKSDEYTGHIFYNGKELGSSEGAEGWSIETYSELKKVRHGWALVRFDFGGILAHNRPQIAAVTREGFVVADNPGKYEIKILRKGELARVASFTILPNGKMDDGLTKTNNLRGSWILVPSKVMGALDGKYDANSWNTDLLWGNVPKGFQIAQ